ncbi:hypothetical protein Tco_1102870 [Tanacetum coccineum]
MVPWVSLCPLEKSADVTALFPNGTTVPRALDKNGTKADVSASDWSANDWSTFEGTRILYVDKSGADTSVIVSPYHVPLGHMLEKPLCKSAI